MTSQMANIFNKISNVLFPKEELIELTGPDGQVIKLTKKECDLIQAHLNAIKNYITFRVDNAETFLERLDDLAERSGTTRDDVLSRSIGLYTEALNRAEEGRVITFVPEAVEDQILFSEIDIGYNQRAAYDNFCKEMNVKPIINCEGIYNLLGAIDDYSFDEHF
jgi:hypothetical protein